MGIHIIKGKKREDFTLIMQQHLKQLPLKRGVNIMVKSKVVTVG